MFASVISSIFVILLLSGSHTTAVAQPDEQANSTQTASAKVTLAPASTTPRKLPLDVRLAHWASMALVGLVAVDGLWGVFSIIANTNRQETVKSDPNAPHPFLKMPHKVIKTQPIQKLVNVSNPNARLNLNEYRDLHYQPTYIGTKHVEASYEPPTYTKDTLAELKSDTETVVKGIWEACNFDIHECFDQIQNCDFTNVQSIALFTKRPQKNSAPTDFAFVFKEALLGEQQRVTALHYKPHPWQKIEIDRLPYIIRASIAHALTFIASTALVRWMYKNPPAASPSSTKRAAGFTIAGLGIGAAGAVTHWKGSIIYLHPVVPFLTAASLLLRGYAEWRSSKIARDGAKQLSPTAP